MDNKEERTCMCVRICDFLHNMITGIYYWTASQESILTTHYKQFLRLLNDADITSFDIECIKYQLDVISSYVQ